MNRRRPFSGSLGSSQVSAFGESFSCAEYGGFDLSLSEQDYEEMAAEAEAIAKERINKSKGKLIGSEKVSSSAINLNPSITSKETKTGEGDQKIGTQCSVRCEDENVAVFTINNKNLEREDHGEISISISFSSKQAPENSGRKNVQPKSVANNSLDSSCLSSLCSASNEGIESNNQEIRNIDAGELLTSVDQLPPCAEISVSDCRVASTITGGTRLTKKNSGTEEVAAPVADLRDLLDSLWSSSPEDSSYPRSSFQEGSTSSLARGKDHTGSQREKINIRNRRVSASSRRHSSTARSSINSENNKTNSSQTLSVSDLLKSLPLSGKGENDDTNNLEFNGIDRKNGNEMKTIGHASFGNCESSLFYTGSEKQNQTSTTSNKKPTTHNRRFIKENSFGDQNDRNQLKLGLQSQEKQPNGGGTGRKKFIDGESDCGTSIGSFSHKPREIAFVKENQNTLKNEPRENSFSLDEIVQGMDEILPMENRSTGSRNFKPDENNGNHSKDSQKCFHSNPSNSTKNPAQSQSLQKAQPQFSPSSSPDANKNPPFEEDINRDIGGDSTNGRKRPKYVLGAILQSKEDIIREPSSEHEMKCISQLKTHDFAFIRRSNNRWTYAIVADRTEKEIRFVLDGKGATKKIERKNWVYNIRRINTNRTQSFTSEGSDGSSGRAEGDESQHGRPHVRWHSSIE